MVQRGDKPPLDSEDSGRRSIKIRRLNDQKSAGLQYFIGFTDAFSGRRKMLDKVHQQHKVEFACGKIGLNEIA